VEKTYGTCISVALEHENDPTYTHVEMNKLQIVNAPLKVLIAYPNSRSHGDKMLEGYREIVSAADIFNDISTSRPQLVRFGFPGPPWQGFVYTGSGSNGFSPELLNA
jgi:hypothetical protein